MKINVILLDRLSAFVKRLVFSAPFADKLSCSKGPDRFFVKNQTMDGVTDKGLRSI
jgi:hypothetical protein